MNYRLRTIMLAAVLLVAVGGAAACSPGGEPSEDGSATQLDITAKDFSFTPNELRIKVDQHYQVRLKNEGTTTLHDWTVDSIPVRDVSVGESDEHEMAGMEMGADDDRLHIAADVGHTSDISFTPTRAGEYDFYCGVPGHRELGMQGKLIVEE